MYEIQNISKQTKQYYTISKRFQCINFNKMIIWKKKGSYMYVYVFFFVKQMKFEILTPK